MILDLSKIATELWLKEATSERWVGFDPETGALVYFGSLEQLNAWVQSTGKVEV